MDGRTWIFQLILNSVNFFHPTPKKWLISGFSRVCERTQIRDLPSLFSQWGDDGLWKDLLADAMQGIWILYSQDLRPSVHLITQVLLRMKLCKEELIYIKRAPDTCNADLFVISHLFICCLVPVSNILQENSSFLYGRSKKIVRYNLLKQILRRCWFNKLRCFKRIYVKKNLDWKSLKCFLLKKIGKVCIYFYD